MEGKGSRPTIVLRAVVMPLSKIGIELAAMVYISIEKVLPD